MLSRNEAIRDAKAIWRLVLEGNAETKYEALNQLPQIKAKKYRDSCPLCAYGESMNRVHVCSVCPYKRQFTYCTSYPSYNIEPRLFAKNIMALKEDEDTPCGVPYLSDQQVLPKISQNMYDHLEQIIPIGGSYYYGVIYTPETWKVIESRWL